MRVLYLNTADECPACGCRVKKKILKEDRSYQLRCMDCNLLFEEVIDFKGGKNDR